MSLRKWHPYLVLAFCSILYLYPFTRVFLWVGDQGTLLYGAVRVTEGQVPFRDFFEVMGPGTFYWLALFFKIFGTTCLATRIWLMLNTVLTTILVYFLTRRLRPGAEFVPAVFLLAVSFPYCSQISHHADSNLFALLSFATMIFWLQRRQPILLFITGILAGVTTCFMQPKGFLLFLSYLLLLCLLCRKEPGFLLSAARLLAGYTLVGLSVVLLFWAAGALSDLLYANVVWPLTNYSNLNTVPYGLGLRALYWKSWTASLSNVFSPAVALCAASILVVPFLVIAALPLLLGLFGLLHRSVAFNRHTLPYWIVGFALWGSEIHRKDITHLIYGSPILVILCFHLYWQVRHRFSVLALQSVVLCAVALAVFNGFFVLAASTKTVTERGTVNTFGNDAALDLLHSHVKPGEELFAYPYCPLYYFLSAAKNPTRYSILMYQINTRAQFQEVVRSLEQRKVRYVLWDTEFQGERVKTSFPAYRIPRQDELIIEPYLIEHYDVVERNNAFCLLERKDTKTASAAPARPSAP
jgi:Dolichyl-phosphate-mannose-protein mannosyltransferase